MNATPMSLLEQHPRVQRIVRRTALAWQTPSQRRLLLALGWALASVTAFAHIA